MASLQQKKSGWYCQFLFEKKRYTFALGPVAREEAEAKASHVEYLLLRLRQGLLEIPPDVDVVEFVRHDGTPPAKRTVHRAAARRSGTLVELRDRYLATHEGAHEKSTLYTAGIHFKHLIQTLGDDYRLSGLAQADLQKHVDRRFSCGVSPATVKKEIDGLRAAWNWGRTSGIVDGDWPGKGLVYGKTRQKPHFQTRDEIRRQIACGGLSDEQIEELWESLYLTSDELASFLEYVKSAARHPWIYPMVCFAAHTGARRSELLRVRIADVDFTGRAAILRERKRVRGRQTTRRVPLSSFLADVLRAWLGEHPGGVHLFCHSRFVARSRKRSLTTGHKNGKARPTSLKERLASVTGREAAAIAPLTVNEASDHFARTIKDGEWSVVPGWHALRHSFASICASKGVDQRLVNAWMGHQTLEQQQRYQHLFPQQQQDAIRSAFG
ncbi:MAG: recombinase XerD [Planctomycetales bacterium 71-10]|nr:MAG: recombinase XerD [Planctomycetales bacterium 71-10]